MINTGQVRDPELGEKYRSKQISRRVPTWQPREARREDDGRVDELVEVLERMEHSCLLQLVHNEKRYTLDEVGIILNVSRERIRQIETLAIKRLKKRGHDPHEDYNL